MSYLGDTKFHVVLIISYPGLSPTWDLLSIFLQLARIRHRIFEHVADFLTAAYI